MPRYRPPCVLSTNGSIRGTAYGFSNKSVTLGRYTHVVWLERPATVCGRTYDHQTDRWDEARALGDGADNHTSPALIADSYGEPHLRLVWGPHGAGWNGGRFKWAISAAPNTIAAWKWPHDFGYQGTYPALVHVPPGVDALAYRGGEWPPSVMFQRQRSLREWTKAREVFRQDVPPQYTHYNATLAAHTDGTLYLACHFYNVANDLAGPEETHLSHGQAIVKTTDLGETWTDLGGNPVAVPTTWRPDLAIPSAGVNSYLAALAVDAQGVVTALSCSPDLRSRQVLVSRWLDGQWVSTDAGAWLPADRTAVDGVLTVDTHDRLHLAVTAVLTDGPANPFSTACWGHPSGEVFHLVSADHGRSFSCRQVSESDDRFPSWLPNLSRNGPYQPVVNPVILYTHGSPGANFTPGVPPPPEPTTDICCVFVEQDGDP